MDKLDDMVLGILIFIAIIAVLVVVMALPTMFLWNALMPEVFGLPTISFGQAVMMNLLSTILFKNANINNKSK